MRPEGVLLSPVNPEGTNHCNRPTRPRDSRSAHKRHVRDHVCDRKGPAHQPAKDRCRWQTMSSSVRHVKQAAGSQKGESGARQTVCAAPNRVCRWPKALLYVLMLRRDVRMAVAVMVCYRVRGTYCSQQVSWYLFISAPANFVSATKTSINLTNKSRKARQQHHTVKVERAPVLVLFTSYDRATRPEVLHACHRCHVHTLNVGRKVRPQFGQRKVQPQFGQHEVQPQFGQRKLTWGPVARPGQVKHCYDDHQLVYSRQRHDRVVP